MSFKLFGNLYRAFLENEFRLIPGFFDKSDVTEESIYVGVYRQIGHIIYAVALINEKAAGDKCFNYIAELKKISRTVFENAEVSNIIFLNVIVSDNPSEDIIQFSREFDFDSEKRFIDLCWIADPFNKKIIVGGNQPDKILNIHKIIYERFNTAENGTSLGKSVYEIAADVKNENKKAIKAVKCTATYILIIINILVLTLMEMNGGSQDTEVLIRFGAVVPELIIYGHEFYRLFTAMFIHIGIIHLLANLLSLYILGSRAEKYFGSGLFLVIYFLSGAGASAASVLFTGSVSAGASGAIFGIMGSMLVYSIMSGKSFGDFSGYFILMFSLVNIGAGFAVDGIDNAGHIGGFIVGAVISLIYGFFNRRRKSAGY